MNKKEKRIKEVISEINRETEIKWEEEVIDVSDSKDSFFTKWLTVQSNMEKRREIVIGIQKMLRSQGYDVKMNMQNYELFYLGKFPKKEVIKKDEQDSNQI